MKEEDLFPNEYQQRKQNMRPDALVIPDDVLRVMQVPRAEWTTELKTRIQDCIDEAKAFLFPSECLEAAPLVFHQQVTDRVIALAVVLASTEDKRRRKLLGKVIKNSQISARTNYQFVRHFIRRGLYPILRENNIPVPEGWNMTINVKGDLNISITLPPAQAPKDKNRSDSIPGRIADNIITGLGTELGKLIIKAMLAYLLLEAAGVPVTETARKLLSLLIAKGEFEHYDEIKDVLKAIKDADPSGKKYDLGVLKGTETGWEYVRKGLEFRGIPCITWSPDAPRVRYYAFPVTHMLLFALGDEQFLAFSGGDPEAVKSTRELFLHDVRVLGLKP